MARPAGVDSHTLIGSIIGVGLANALMHGRRRHQRRRLEPGDEVGYSLLLSPLVGFVAAALLLLVAEAPSSSSPELYEEPKGSAPPPWWIRGLLILTCTGVSRSRTARTTARRAWA